jgi:hypothetical protein
MTQIVINTMNTEADELSMKPANLLNKDSMQEQMESVPSQPVHLPTGSAEEVAFTVDKAMIGDDDEDIEDPLMPDLSDDVNDDSDSELGDSVVDMEQELQDVEDIMEGNSNL